MIAIAALFALSAPVAAAASPIVAITVPSSPFLEKRGDGTHINFDVILHNQGDVPLRLVSIREQVFGPRGDLVQQREINANGRPSALAGLGELLLPPGGYKDLYQPFQDLDGAPDRARIRLTLIFLRPDRPVPPVALAGDAVVMVDVTPRAYRPAAYCLPLSGRLLVHDGHDLNSHHRRRDLVASTVGDPAKGLNANLYAYDFVRIGPDGALFHDVADRKENWLTFGAVISSPVAGIVTEAVDGVPDNSFRNGQAEIPKAAEAVDPQGFGNHVVVRAADGRVSWLLHMEPGTVAVKTGDRVRAGQTLGRVGFSGDSLFPHLHYTVTNAATYPSQGVPSYFAHFRRAAGGAIAYGQIDTGDLVEADQAPGCRAGGRR